MHAYTSPDSERRSFSDTTSHQNEPGNSAKRKFSEAKLQIYPDERSEALAQLKLQEAASQSQQVVQAASVQQMANQYASAQVVQKKNDTCLPDQLKSGIEHLSGYSLDDVKVHYNSAEPEKLQAHAYAQGTDIHVASGQQEHLAHEAWHVVQQKQGRVKPTKQLKGKVAINDDAGLEKEADAMGAKALQLQSHPESRKTSPLSPVILQRREDAVIQPVFGFVTSAYNSLIGNTPPPFAPKLTIPIPTATAFTALYKANKNNPGLHFNHVTRTIYSNLNHQHLLETLDTASRHALLTLPAVGGAPGASPQLQFANAFSSNNYSQTIAANERRLVRRARKKANNINYANYDNTSPNWGNPANLAGLLQGAEGAILGEDHGDDRHRRYISQNIRRLKARGINTIYNEHFRDEHQPEIDQYLASRFWQSTPHNLDKFLTAKDQGQTGPGTLRYMLEQARIHGVRIVGVDSLAAQADIVGPQSNSLRNTLMNQEAYARILNDQHNRNGAGYLLLVGAAHSNTHALDADTQNEHFTGGSPGLSQLLNIPAYQIDDFGNVLLDPENAANR
jgi:hypothetical protein